MKLPTGWRLHHLYLVCLLIPAAGLVVLTSLWGGNFVTAALALAWGVLAYSADRQHQGWRDRTNAWMVAEKEDRARFAIEVLQLQAQAAMSFWDRYGALAREDPEVMKVLMTIYKDVSETWLPDDADEKFQAVKRHAARVVETGVPERVLH